MGAALAVALLAAGGVTAAVTQDDDHSGTAVSSRASGAPVAALDSGASGAGTRTVDESALQATSSGSTGSSALVAGGQAVAETADAATLPASSLTGPDGPRIVKRADVRVEVKEGGFRAAFERAAAVAGAHGGFVASSTSRTASDKDDEPDPASGTLVLRVPAAAFDAVRADLADLGEVASEVIDGEDVGGQLVDLDARIRSLQVEEEALRALMGKAKTVGETIEVQQQLTRVRQQIEQAAGQRGTLADAAALATIRADLFEPGVEVRTEPGDPNPVAEGLRDAVDGSMAVLGGTLVVLGYLLPFGLLAGLGWAGWRMAARRRPPAAPVTGA
jgi:hypothetical protein